MRKYVTILIMLLCVGFISCSDDSNDVPAFKIAGNEMDITAVGGTVTVTLSMDGEKATSDQSWCTASVSGKTVELTLEKNVSLEGRTALITVTKGEESISFPVTQPGNIIPRPDTDAININAHGGVKEINVAHALPFKAELPTGVDWIDVQVDGSKLILTTQTNYTRNELSTKVKLISEGLESEVDVKQTGIELVPEKTSVVMFNGGSEIKVMVNSTLAFEAVSDKDWLTVTKDDTSVTLTAGDNSGNPERTATVTLTSESLTATINVTQRPPIYTDYLGNWALTGVDENGDPLTYNISIEQSIAGSIYKVTSWGKSVVATDPEFAIKANFDTESGLIYIVSQENIGVFTDVDDSQYNIMFYGRVEIGGEVYFVGGAGYICYIGQMQPDGSVQWMNGQVDIGEGPMPVIGANYFGVDSEDNTYTFKGDDPFIRKPRMFKVGTRAGWNGNDMTRSAGSFATKLETRKLIFK